MNEEQKQLSKARQALVDRVLSRLDAGAMPWETGMQVITTPYNAISGAHYRGINLLSLFLAGKPDPRWLTFNQAKDNGYTVKKGAHGVPIELYKTIDKRTGKDADFVKIKEEIKDMTFAERQMFKRDNLQSFARSYYVFNAGDVLGMEPYKPNPIDESARNERIEQIIANSEAPVFYDGKGQNFYNPGRDEIHLTERAAFTSAEFFYNTALHEMAHSTGHSSRLNRKGGTYGTSAYAREELVAEISSVLTAAELGLNHSDRIIENSAEYVRSWAQLIRDNPQTLIDAAFDASHATDYICERERQRVQTKEKTQKENSQSNATTLYEQYTATQKKYPDAVVVQRLGDFYEVLGDKAHAIADELDLTLTGRDVGLSERVPMCGFPYHVMEQYIEKIRQNHDVTIVENTGKEIYMPSLKTPLEESAQKESLRSNIKEWYARTFPTDELASSLDENATFGTVRDALRAGKDIYSVLGSADSVVRERVFKGLSEVLDVPYKAVYDAWTNGGSVNSGAWVAEKDGKNVVIGTWETHDISESVQVQKPSESSPTAQKHAQLHGRVSEMKTQKENVAAYELKTNLGNIPTAMKALPNWVAFRTETLDDGKVKKILLSPNKGASSVDYLKWAKSGDPTTWATFEKAAAFAKKYKLDGLAFAMSGSGMTCIDLDHHLDKNGKPSELAQKYINAAQGTYIEKSVSGHGLHIFYAGSRPSGHQNRNIDLDLETYDSARFMSMTGNLYENASKDIAAPSAELINLLKSNLAKLQQYSAPSVPLGMDDNALIDKIRNSKVGNDFEALWRGNDIAGDHSVSDFKLCNMLAFFSGGDAAQVERCFRSSGLYRPQKGDAYVRRTAEKACATLVKSYTPSKPKTSGKPSGGNSSSGSSGR